MAVMSFVSRIHIPYGPKTLLSSMIGSGRKILGKPPFPAPGLTPHDERKNIKDLQPISNETLAKQDPSEQEDFAPNKNA